MEFTIGTTVYRAGKLDAFRQLHIVRRLAPCAGKLAALAGGGVKLKYDANGKATDFDGDIAQALAPLSDAIAALKDEDVEYILNACLEATERKQAGGRWVPLRAGGTTMFDDLSLPVMIQIAYHTIKENLTDFFAGPPSLSGLEGFMRTKGLLG